MRVQHSYSAYRLAYIKDIKAGDSIHMCGLATLQSLPLHYVCLQHVPLKKKVALPVIQAQGLECSECILCWTFEITNISHLTLQTMCKPVPGTAGLLPLLRDHGRPILQPSAPIDIETQQWLCLAVPGLNSSHGLVQRRKQMHRGADRVRCRDLGERQPRQP